jgi:AraC-like DNA-binding protein/quercetin dioxygenase-like cupin family protein
MSQIGQATSVYDVLPHDDLVVGRFTMSRGTWFPRHSHPAHQLAWSARGTLSVRVPGWTYVLPPTLALWLPAHVPPATGALSPAAMRGVYLQPDRFTIGWTEPTVVAVPPLLRELIEFLAVASAQTDARSHAEALLGELLRPAPSLAVRVPDLRDDRARRIADALTADPSDARGLAQWAGVVNTSTRTLARVWLTETGMGFARWRTQLRLQAALPMLASGTPVGTVARAVGYRTPSAFVAIFKATLGVPPGQYFGRSDATT